MGGEKKLSHNVKTRGEKIDDRGAPCWDYGKVAAILRRPWRERFSRGKAKSILGSKAWLEKTEAEASSICLTHRGNRAWPAGERE